MYHQDTRFALGIHLAKMGSFLDKPKTEKDTHSLEGLDMRCAVSSMQGWRIDQEDAHTATIGIPSHPELSWFGVFDGHGGALISQQSASKLLDYVDLSSPDPEALKKTLRDAFIRLDGDLRNLPEVQRGDDHSGSTAITALVSPSHIVACNCGDSRSILVRDSKAIAMSHDHKPFLPEEQARIVNAGGTVSMRRVNGDLAVSRALGDYVYKNQVGKKPEEQQVSCEPTFEVEEREDGDQFLVLACDGIWDVMSNDEVAQYLLDSTAAGIADTGELAEALIDECLAKGSRDNMSAIIIAFKNAPKPSAVAMERYAKAKAEADRATTSNEKGEDMDVGYEDEAGGAKWRRDHMAAMKERGGDGGDRSNEG